MAIKLAFALLLLAASASAQDANKFRVSMTCHVAGSACEAGFTPGTLSTPAPKVGMSRPAWAVMLAGQGLDVATMAYALRDPRFREANPLGEVGVYAVKAGLIAGIPWLLKHFGATRKQLDGVGYAFGAIGATAGTWNLHQIQKAGR